MSQHFSKATTDIIRARFSCRNYLKQPIEVETLAHLTDFITSIQSGPLGNQMRFELVSATDTDAKALKGLGTYGFIKGATGFVVGAMHEQGKALEDFGYLMEMIILQATDLGLGTCWLGGTFTKSRFAKKIDLAADEIIPAVTSLGYIEKAPRWADGKIRAAAGSDHRLPWEKLFFNSQLGAPLAESSAGDYGIPLQMVRLAPSASNRQPWRIVKDGRAWHFYLRRTRGYRDSKYAKMLKMADLQRIDIGIAMSHFEMTAGELGLLGSWFVNDPGLALPNEMTEYCVSWRQAY